MNNPNMPFPISIYAAASAKTGPIQEDMIEEGFGGCTMTTIKLCIAIAAIELYSFFRQ